MISSKIRNTERRWSDIKNNKFCLFARYEYTIAEWRNFDWTQSMIHTSFAVRPKTTCH